jgi:hypothetical protein
MPDRSTPSPELTPNDPSTLNGGSKNVDSSTMSLLLDLPSEQLVAEVARQAAEAQPSLPVTESVPNAVPAKRNRAADLLPLVERRGVRTTTAGALLVAAGIVLGASSAVSVALLILGVVMLIVGLMGRHIQGRFSIEFGPGGASIELQTHIASPEHHGDPEHQPIATEL